MALLLWIRPLRLPARPCGLPGDLSAPLGGELLGARLPALRSAEFAKRNGGRVLLWRLGAVENGGARRHPACGFSDDLVGELVDVAGTLRGLA